MRWRPRRSPTISTAALLDTQRQRKPLALTPEDRAQWLTQLEADERAVRRDLPDLTRWMPATGVRIGEALAVGWDEVDLDDASASIEWILTR